LIDPLPPPWPALVTHPSLFWKVVERAANDGAALAANNATANKAVTSNKLMRLVMLSPFPTPGTRF